MPKTIAKIGKAIVSGFVKFFGAFGGAKLPKQTETQVPIKQSVQPRRSAFGRVKVGGLYSLFEAVDQTSVDVLALLHGRSQGFVQHYLDDDKVDVDAGTGGVWCPEDTRKYAYGGPPGDRTFILTRLGLPTETAYAQVTALYPAWDADHRGDGVTSLALICKQSKDKFQNEDFPNGLPKPSPVIDAQLVYDPRDGAQVQGDKSTYVYSRNPALCLMAYMTDAEGGMGLDYDRNIAPHVATWIAAADDCDLAEVTEAGTEPRYECAGCYDHDTAPGEVIAAILSTFDGFLAPAGDGAYVLHPGRYVAPTVTLTDRHVVGYTLQHYLPDEQATNEYVVSFIDPAADYNKGDAGVVRNQPDIDARGVVRSTGLDLDWVQSAPQAIRLARRRLSRSTEPLRGTTTFTLYGLTGLGERYLTLQISDNPLLADLVVEVTGPGQIDLANLTVSIPWIAADTGIDDGDPGAGVTIPPTPDPRPQPGPLAAPTIDAVTPLYEAAAGAESGARLEIDVTAPLEADVEWLARWRAQGDLLWHEAAYTDVDDGAAVTLVTGFVLAAGNVEVQVAYRTAGGTSPWSATETVAVDAPAGASADVTAVGALAAGKLGNIHAAGVRYADASNGREANCWIKAATANGDPAPVRFGGKITGLTGLTKGPAYLDAASPGGIVSAAPASPNLVQQVGVAISATEVIFDPQPPVQLT